MTAQVEHQAVQIEQRLFTIAEVEQEILATAVPNPHLSTTAILG